MMHIFHKSIHSRKRGFTLIETLVAIVILTMATTAAMSALQMGLRGNTYARNEITAYYLAEEGIEVVRYLRDTNALTPGAYWLDNIDSTDPTKDCMGAAIRCDADLSNPATPKLAVCPSGTCRALNFNATESGSYPYYKYVGGAGGNSRFTRSIQIERKNTSIGSGTHAVVGEDAILVTVTVTWSGSVFNNKTITLQDELYNWQ